MTDAFVAKKMAMRSSKLVVTARGGQSTSTTRATAPSGHAILLQTQEIFERHRDPIEGLASDKFDKGRIEGEPHEAAY